MKSLREIKNLRTYVELEDSNNREDIITVEHRSNNPKRDYLFVNKLQCKHIPCSPTAMTNMCIDLANKVTHKLIDSTPMWGKLLVIGFAETATAIADTVANHLYCNAYVMHTTREFIEFSQELINFKEEHSHATDQFLLTHDYTDVDTFLKQFSYILFVEDEISTGKTILNFINAFRSQYKHLNLQAKFGVASICNWQNEEYKKAFKELEIDRFYLISGEIKDTNAKIFNNEDELRVHLVETEDSVINEVPNIETLHDESGSLFGVERLGHLTGLSFDKSNDFESLMELIKDRLKLLKAESVRVIGTEEFMFTPISIGRHLENAGYNVICHATTRSKIDVLNSTHDGESTGIKSRHEVPSAYDDIRQTYVYNLGEKTDVTLLVTDSINEVCVNRLLYRLRQCTNTDSIILIRL